MYRAFKLTSNGFGLFNLKNKYQQDGQQVFNEQASQFNQTLKGLLQDGKIDGSAMQDKWFPKIEAEVFISHSHTDEDLAKGLAGWLKKEVGVTAFIDSLAWGHADELLQQIDDGFCRNAREGTYDYHKRNASTSHVHMMLAGALAQMMDSAECVFFIGSPNSVSTANSVERVSSPWINYELMLMQTIRQRMPRHQTDHSRRPLKEGLLPIDYKANFGSLTSLALSHLQNWANAKRSDSADRHSLDLLYEIAPQ